MEAMERERNFWIVGGDLRHRALARLLREEGHTVHLAAVRGEGVVPEPLSPVLRLAHCVILPLPVTEPDEETLHTPLSPEPVSLSALLDLLEPGQLLCGGMAAPAVEAAVQARGMRLADYYEREECKVANAVPTAAAKGPTPSRGTAAGTVGLLVTSRTPHPRQKGRCWRPGRQGSCPPVSAARNPGGP